MKKRIALLSILVLLVLTLVPVLSIQAAPTYLDFEGSYTFTNSVPTKCLNGGTSPNLVGGTLTITTQTDQTVSSASLTLGNTVALTGIVGSGSRPYISLVGDDDYTKVVINGKATVVSGSVTGVNGRIDGWTTNNGTLAADGGGSTAWETTIVHNGSVSAKLMTAAARGSNDGAKVVIPWNKAIATIPSAQKTVSTMKVISGINFWYYNITGNDAFPYVVLDIDHNGDGITDSWLVNAWSTPKTYDAWTLGYPTDATLINGEWFGGWRGYGLIAGTYYYTLAGWKTALKGDIVKNVKVDIGYSGGGAGSALTTYIDDIKIGSTTYNIGEPIQFSGGLTAKK